MGGDDESRADAGDAGQDRPRAPRKRKARASRPPEGKRSLNLSIPRATYQRLALHAIHFDINISDLVARLADEHCRAVHLTTTPGEGRRTDAA